MVTGVGFCGRIGRRRRERQLKELCETPEKYHFYPPPASKHRKLIITDKDGKTTIRRL